MKSTLRWLMALQMKKPKEVHSLPQTGAARVGNVL